MNAVMPVAVGNVNDHAQKIESLARSLKAAFAARLCDDLERIQACGMCDEMIGHAAVLMDGREVTPDTPPVEVAATN